ncbi:MAG: transglycosylase SLT domain-containing protein [Methylococcaceae bacterium]|jgi:soluble lytic murein transglycosylase
MNIKCIPGSLLLCGLFFFSSTVFSNTLEQQRQDFLLAERLVEQGNDNAFLTLSSTLADYPLYPYLQYQWLKNNLQQADKILAFLSAYKDTRYADLLRSKWLHYLADNERWIEFLLYYQASDNAALECQFYWAIYKVANQQMALNEAKRLWVTEDSLPNECDPLLSALALSPALTPDLVWQRFELALKKDNRPLASYVRHLLNKPDQDVADVWLQVHNKPALIQDSLFLGGNERQGRIFAHGVDRMAKLDLDLAINIWDSRKSTVFIDNQTAQQIECKLALALARARDNRAYNRLNQLVAVDAEVREWKVRAALLEQNWVHVAHALTGLTIEEQQEPQWQYWQARSLIETGKTLEGWTIYNRLSEDRSYYGFMAADAVNKPYSIADKPVFLAANVLETLAQKTDFKVIQELTILNREAEAKRQWWFGIKKLPKDQLKIAAKLAQQWQWDQVAIITMVKADYWDDLALRFPVSYLSQVQNNAYWQNLDPAIIFGLIRQESMLDKNARSAVGARGLMQIMPATGQQIARTLNEPWQAENSLFNPDVNIKYGAFYYKQLLNRFGGHFALATAAYNAGPNRVVKWLPNDRSVPADVWIETIPFKETRKYVTSVLAYAIIYQQRIQRNALKITRLLFDVRPY